MTDIEIKRKLRECKESGMTIEQALQYLEVAPDKSVPEYLESIEPSIERYKEIMNDDRPGPDTPGVVNLFAESDKKK